MVKVTCCFHGEFDVRSVTGTREGDCFGESFVCGGKVRTRRTGRFWSAREVHDECSATFSIVCGKAGVRLVKVFAVFRKWLEEIRRIDIGLVVYVVKW